MLSITRGKGKPINHCESSAASRALPMAPPFIFQASQRLSISTRRPSRRGSTTRISEPTEWQWFARNQWLPACRCSKGMASTITLLPPSMFRWLGATSGSLALGSPMRSLLSRLGDGEFVNPARYLALPRGSKRVNATRVFQRRGL